MATVARKIGKIPPTPYPTQVRKTLVFRSTARWGIVVAKWPDTRPGRLHPVTQQQKATWDLVQEIIKFIDAGEYAQALALSTGTRFYRRDILVMSAYGHYVSFPDPGVPPAPPVLPMALHAHAEPLISGPSGLSPTGGWGPYPQGGLTGIKAQLKNTKSYCDTIAGDIEITNIATISSVGINDFVTGPGIVAGTTVLAYDGTTAASLSVAPFATATHVELTFTRLALKAAKSKTKGNTAAREAGNPQSVNVITQLTATNDGATATIQITTKLPAVPTLMLFCCAPIQVKTIERRGLSTLPGKGPWWFPCTPQWFAPTSSSGQTYTWELPNDAVSCDNCFYTFAQLGLPGALEWGSQYYPCPQPSPIGSGGFLYGEAPATINVTGAIWMASASVATVFGTVSIAGDVFGAEGFGYVQGAAEHIFNGAPGSTAVTVLIDGSGGILATGAVGTCNSLGEGVSALDLTTTSVPSPYLFNVALQILSGSIDTIENNGSSGTWTQTP